MEFTDASATPKARQGVETYIVPDGSCFLFDPASDASYVLDPLGALVWDYCDGQTPVEQMLQEIADLLPADVEAQARARRLLADFTAEGLLESAPTTDATPLTDETTA